MEHARLREDESSDADAGSDYGSKSESGEDSVFCRPCFAYAALVLGPIVFITLGAYFQVGDEGVTFAQQHGFPFAMYPGVRDAWRNCSGSGREEPWTEDLHVNLLLMAIDDIPFPDIWLEFFAGAPSTSYGAYVHCKHAAQCEANLKASGLDALFTVVPTVYNEWCVDLLSPMLQLLTISLQAVPAERFAKFVFLSTDHLPIKPFRTIQVELGKHPGASDFCLYPPTYWHVALDDPSVLAVAATQWSVLSRIDAEALLRRMPKPTPATAIAVPKLEGRGWSDFSFKHCIDEVSVFSTIFGLFHNHTIVNGSEVTTSEYPGVGAVDIDEFEEQGCCRTWGFMGGGTREQVDAMLEGWALISPLAKTMELLRAVPDSSVEIPLSHCETGCEAIGVVMGLGPQGMRLLRDSPFLFGRKFAHNASLPGFGGAMFGA